MRGQKLFKVLMDEWDNDNAIGKGRNVNLMLRRNECLIDRYYYYSRFSKKCYEEILNRLVDEFFLSTERISRIVQENTDKILFQRKQNATVYYLKNKWPHLRWSQPEKKDQSKKLWGVKINCCFVIRTDAHTKQLPNVSIPIIT